MWTKRILLVALQASIAVFLLAGCVGRIDPSAYPTSIRQVTAFEAATSPITSPTPNIIKSTRTPPPQPTAAGTEYLLSDKLVCTIVEDLAKRISLDPKKISLVEATRIDWSDASLGCPQPGIAYSQVITPGFRMVLEAQGQRYEYHTGQDERFILCETNQAYIDPVPVMPVAPHGKPPKCQWTACP